MIYKYKSGSKIVEKSEQQVGKGLNRVQKTLDKAQQGYNRLMETIGGGNRAAVEIRNSSETFGQRHILDKAKSKTKTAINKANQAEKEFNELNEIRKQLSKPTMSDMRSVVAARNKSRILQKEAREAQLAESIAKNELNQAALKLVRKKGFNRLAKLGALGALGYGGYKAFTSEDNNKEENESNYRWTPDNGWQQRDDDGNWNNQQEEFGVDRFGNTNFYDTETGQWYSDYIQGSDGSIYDRQGNLLGNVMPQGGNFFDYNAQQVAQQLGRDSLSPTEIMALQQQLGVNPDGLIGARTLNAIAKQSGNPQNYFTIYS